MRQISCFRISKAVKKHGFGYIPQKDTNPNRALFFIQQTPCPNFPPASLYSIAFFCNEVLFGNAEILLFEHNGFETPKILSNACDSLLFEYPYSNKSENRRILLDSLIKRLLSPNNNQLSQKKYSYLNSGK